MMTQRGTSWAVLVVGSTRRRDAALADAEPVLESLEIATPADPEPGSRA